MRKAVLLLFVAFLVYFAYGRVQVVCPAESDPGKDYSLIPHPCNCSSYYVCYQGFPTPMPCYPGLEWNKEKKQCDYPYISNCSLNPNCNTP